MKAITAMAALLVWLALTGICGADDWPSYRHDHNNSGTARATVKFSGHLKPGWVYKTESRMTSSPVITGGIVYVGTWNGDLIALDQNTGRQRWSVHLGANSDESYGGPRGVIGSVAIENGAAYVASGNCTVAAVSVPSGHKRWKTRVCDNRRNDDIYASPVVTADTVLIGNDMLADRPTDRGREVSLDVRTGKLRWMLEPAMYRGMGTGISATPAIDVRSSIAYLGTGNPLPMNDPPPGNDDGSDSIIAFDIGTGKRLWKFGPVHPHDTQDEDFFASPNRFYVRTGHSGRWLIGEGNKDATYYAVSASDGKPLWKTAVGYAPSATIVGTAAVSGNQIFVPVYLNDSSGSLTALRTTDGKILWSQRTGGEYEAPLVFGNAVFTTEAMGWLVAFRAADGAFMGRWKLCGKATGRGPSAANGNIYVAAGNCVSAFEVR